MERKFDESLMLDGGKMELSDDMDKLINKKIIQAEKDIEQKKVQIRWGTKQIEVLKKAASIMGIPYQTYVKHVAYRQAMEDIERSMNISK